MKTILVVLVFSALLCLAQAQQSETWQKTKECADQAEKVARQIKAQHVRGESAWLNDGESISYRNHYSPNYDRCFMVIDHWFAPVIRMMAAGPLRGEAVGLMTELEDAFERTPLAYIFARSSPSEPCHIGRDSVDCDKAWSFIAEHMAN